MYRLMIFADINFGDPVWQFWLGVGSLSLSALTILITIILAVRGRQKKLLTYEIISNSSVINVENDVGEDLQLVLGGRIVSKVRLHVIKLLNAGNTAIHPEDYPYPLSFEFNSPPYPRPLLRCSIHRTEPETLFPPHVLKDLLAIDAQECTMLLKPPLLNPREALFLKVLLKADHRDSTTMTAIGQIRDGQIKKYTTPPTRITRRAVVIGILIAFVLGLLLSSSIGLVTALAQGVCAFGSIQDGGSTSFYSAVYKEAQQYNAVCPIQIAHIAVNENSSGEGLVQLENGTLQIANSELHSPYADQVDHPVAEIVFALITNKASVNLTNLTSTQIYNIYTGRDKYWNAADLDPNGPALPIKLFGRQGTSGTQTSFVKYVLNASGNTMPGDAQIVPEGSSSEVVSAVASTPGAIGFADYGDAVNTSGSVTILEINGAAPTPALIEKNIYPFWAIEHMYTGPNPDRLALSFVTYVQQNLSTTGSFIHLDPTLQALRP